MNDDDRRWLAEIACDMTAMVLCVGFAAGTSAAISSVFWLPRSVGGVFVGLSASGALLGFIMWNNRSREQDKDRKKVEE